jgi:hypothetical protein
MQGVHNRTRSVSEGFCTYILVGLDIQEPSLTLRVPLKAADFVMHPISPFFAATEPCR